MADIITVKNLVKLYDPDIRAVDDISFAVAEGEIFGFLGPNGAGKSTAIKILTTLLKRTSGDVRIKGFDIEDDAREIRNLIGYASQEIGIDTRPHRPGEHLPAMPLLSHPQGQGAAEDERTSQDRRSDRRRRPPRRHLLRRNETPSRSGHRPGLRPGDSVPGRADDRSRPPIERGRSGTTSAT